MTKEEILNLVKEDQFMMEALRTAQNAHLPDWMIGAGFVRNKVWNHLHNFPDEALMENDIDLMYFDPNDTSEETEKIIDAELKTKLNAKWSSKNQARMHVNHGKQTPYENSEEALAEFVETATCVAVRLNEAGDLDLVAPHGIRDLADCILRPVPALRDNTALMQKRISEKNWLTRWPKLRVEV